MNLLFMIPSGPDSVGLLRQHTLALAALFRGDRFRPVLFLGALLLCAGASAQSDSPVGPVWDCLLSGKRNGIAYLSFSTTNNGTLSGYEILVPQPIVSSRTSLISDALGNNGLGLRPLTTNSPSDGSHQPGQLECRARAVCGGRFREPDQSVLLVCSSILVAPACAGFRI
jgi:hypothetical protein